MEACGGAHFWGREIDKLDHDVRLIPPSYTKPLVKRQKNDAADAEAICEAVLRPTMRLVPVKSEESQAAAMVFCVRERLIRQRTQAITALRGHPRSPLHPASRCQCQIAARHIRYRPCPVISRIRPCSSIQARLR